MAVLGLLLLVAVAFVVTGSLVVPVQTFRGKVNGLLPVATDVPGWTVNYPPLAETVEIKKAIDELLNYDDAAFVIYEKGETRVSIYISYWTPGKTSFRGVASHTPDT
jgi:hypothetical protein